MCAYVRVCNTAGSAQGKCVRKWRKGKGREGKGRENTVAEGLREIEKLLPGFEAWEGRRVRGLGEVRCAWGCRSERARSE